MSTREQAAITLTLGDLETAIYGYTDRERREAARGWMEILAPVFASYGFEGGQPVELQILDEDSGTTHTISLGASRKGILEYERVDGQRETAGKLKDRKAVLAIRDFLTDIGVLYIVED